MIRRYLIWGNAMNSGNYKIIFKMSWKEFRLCVWKYPKGDRKFWSSSEHLGIKTLIIVLFKGFIRKMYGKKEVWIVKM